MDSYNISEAKAKLSAIIEQVVSEGTDVIISRSGRPVARVTPFAPARQARKLGQFRGKIRVRKDFDQWPPELAKALGLVD